MDTMISEHNKTTTGKGYVINNDGTVTRDVGSAGTNSPGENKKSKGWIVLLICIVIILSSIAGIYIYNETSYLEVSKKNIIISASGGITKVNVDSNRDWYISVNTNMGYASKIGNSIQLRIDENPKLTERKDWIEVVCRNCVERINIKQEAKKYLTISSNRISVPSEGGLYTFTVTSNEYWSISVIPAGWGNLTSNGNTLSLRIDANNHSNSRSDYFIIKSKSGIEQRVDITQEGSYLNVSSESLTFPASGGSKTITVSCSSNWYISVNPYAWGHLSRNGHYLTYRVDANKSSKSRDDYIVIKSGNKEKRISVTQYGTYSSNSNNYNSTYVTANIKRVWVNHNVYEAGKYGMRIHVNFSVTGMNNRTGQVAVYFYYANGNPIRDTNYNFRTVDNNVAVSRDFKPRYSNSNYSDFEIFMPYDEIHVYRTSSCYFTISIWNGNTEIASSNKTSFKITW